MRKILVLLSFLFLSCATSKTEIEVANSFVNDPKIVTIHIDLLQETDPKYDCIYALDEYLKYKETYESGKSNWIGDFSFEKGLYFNFSKEDIAYMRETVQGKFSWKNKVDSDKITLIKTPVYKTKSDEDKEIMYRISKNLPIYYMSKPLLNKAKDKAVIRFHWACGLCNPSYFFLIKENNEWRKIGKYEVSLM